MVTSPFLEGILWRFALGFPVMGKSSTVWRVQFGLLLVEQIGHVQLVSNIPYWSHDWGNFDNPLDTH